MGKSVLTGHKASEQLLPCAPRVMHVVSVSRLWQKVTKFWRNLGDSSQLKNYFFPFIYSAFRSEDIRS